MEDFDAWLRAKMEERGLTFAMLAAKTGASPSNVRNWAVGANRPDWHRCYYIAKALGVSVEEVRRRAGFVDPADATPTDEALAALVAMWPQLPAEDQQMLLRLARLQFDSPSRRG